MWLIVVLVLFIILLQYNRECFQSKPDINDIPKYTKQVMNHRELFNDNNLANAYKTMTWLDPVLYEDIRSLSLSNKFTYDNIAKSFY